MPRKSRYKKDPVIQKLTFDEESDAATNSGTSSESNLTRQSETDTENLSWPWGPTPEADAPPTSSGQPGCAEQIPTDFAHRDRLRFSRPEWGTDDDDSPNRFLVTCVCLVGLILLVQWIKTEGYNLFLKWYLDLWTDEESDEGIISASFLGLTSLGFLCTLLVSFLLGLGCVFFSWGITYHDSLQPGQFPPSPISPKKLRKISGHTFHSSYVMALINGIAVFTLSAWWLSTYA